MKQQGFTLKELICILIIIAVLGVIVAPKAEANEGFSVAGGLDFIHDQGLEYAELRWRDNLMDDGLFGYGDSFGWTLYGGSMETVGIGIYNTWGPLLIGWGAEAADPQEDVVETEGGYEILIEYAMTEHWALSLKHRSNCRDVCRNIPGLDALPKGAMDKSNKGFNYLMLRFTF